MKDDQIEPREEVPEVEVVEEVDSDPGEESVDKALVPFDSLQR